MHFDGKQPKGVRQLSCLYRRVAGRGQPRGEHVRRDGKRLSVALCGKHFGKAHFLHGKRGHQAGLFTAAFAKREGEAEVPACKLLLPRDSACGGRYALLRGFVRVELCADLQRDLLRVHGRVRHAHGRQDPARLFDRVAQHERPPRRGKPACRAHRPRGALLYAHGALCVRHKVVHGAKRRAGGVVCAAAGLAGRDPGRLCGDRDVHGRDVQRRGVCRQRIEGVYPALPGRRRAGDGGSRCHKGAECGARRVGPLPAKPFGREDRGGGGLRRLRLRGQIV